MSRLHLLVLYINFHKFSKYVSYVMYPPNVKEEYRVILRLNAETIETVNVTKSTRGKDVPQSRAECPRTGHNLVLFFTSTCLSAPHPEAV